MYCKLTVVFYLQILMRDLCLQVKMLDGSEAGEDQSDTGQTGHAPGKRSLSEGLLFSRWPHILKSQNSAKSLGKIFDEHEKLSNSGNFFFLQMLEKMLT